MKRNRDPEPDATIEADGQVEQAFAKCLELLEAEPINMPSWKEDNRNKLAELLNSYLTRGKAETEFDPSNLKMNSVDNLFAQLEKAKDLLHTLVPASEVDTAAKAPTYEEDIKTFEIDAFMYEDDDEIEQFLIEPGHAARNYCTKCGTHEDVTPTRFISHSFSRHQLAYLFKFVVPQRVMPALTASVSEGLKFVDVGSRFGVVPLTAAYTLPRAQWSQIQGIEYNEKYNKIGCRVVERMAKGGKRPTAWIDPSAPAAPESHYANRVSLHPIDALGPQGVKILEESDLCCFNNVFEWYSETEKLLQVWKDVRAATSKRSATASKKKFLICNPSLEESLAPLLDGDEEKVGEFMNSWVEEVDLGRLGLQFTKDFFDPEATEADDEQIEVLHLYEVIA